MYTFFLMKFMIQIFKAPGPGLPWTQLGCVFPRILKVIQSKLTIFIYGSVFASFCIQDVGQFEPGNGLEVNQAEDKVIIQFFYWDSNHLNSFDFFIEELLRLGELSQKPTF